MTFAWYAHLRNPSDRPWYIASVVSWGIARIVFAPFAVWYMRQTIRLDYLWTALCLVGAVHFVFRSPATS